MWKPRILYLWELFESAVHKISKNQSLLKKNKYFHFSILKCLEALHLPPPIIKLKPKNSHKKVVKLVLHTSGECFRTVLKVSYISKLNITCQTKINPQIIYRCLELLFLLNTEITLGPDNYFIAHKECNF